MKEVQEDWQEPSVKKRRESEGISGASEISLDESDRTSLTSAEDSASVAMKDEFAQQLLHSNSSLSNGSNNGPDSQQQLVATISPYVACRIDLTNASSPVTNQVDTNADAGARLETIESTGVLKRLLIPRNLLKLEMKLLVGLLKYSEPLEIIFEDCSKLMFDSKIEILELIAAHCPFLITLKLYRCNKLFATTKCFKHFDSCFSPRAMEQFASGLDLSHLRVLALHDLPAAATSPHACLLLDQLADRLSTHLLELDLSGADLYFAASFGWLSRLRHLRVLILVNCHLPTEPSLLISAICDLRDLMRLDIAHLSGAFIPDYEYLRPDDFIFSDMFKVRKRALTPTLSLTYYTVH